MRVGLTPTISRSEPGSLSSDSPAGRDVLPPAGDLDGLASMREVQAADVRGLQGPGLGAAVPGAAGCAACRYLPPGQGPDLSVQQRLVLLHDRDVMRFLVRDQPVRVNPKLRGLGYFHYADLGFCCLAGTAGVYVRVRGIGAPIRSKARRWVGVGAASLLDGLAADSDGVAGQGGQVVDQVAEAADGLFPGAGLAGGLGGGRRVSGGPGRRGCRGRAGVRR